jgi:hypothetical protein
MLTLFKGFSIVLVLSLFSCASGSKKNQATKPLAVAGSQYDDILPLTSSYQVTGKEIEVRLIKFHSDSKMISVEDLKAQAVAGAIADCAHDKKWVAVVFDVTDIAASKKKYLSKELQKSNEGKDAVATYRCMPELWRLDGIHDVEPVHQIIKRELPDVRGGLMVFETDEESKKIKPNDILWMINDRYILTQSKGKDIYGEYERLVTGNSMMNDRHQVLVTVLRIKNMKITSPKDGSIFVVPVNTVNETNVVKKKNTDLMMKACDVSFKLNLEQLPLCKKLKNNPEYLF